MDNKKEHWEEVYGKKEDNQVSWYQDVPETSLRLIRDLRLALDDAVIDLGGGNSNLTHELYKEGYQNLSVLDISGLSLARTRKKMGAGGSSVHWIESDVLDFNAYNQYAVIHDRATFHFLTREDEINKYVDIVTKAVKTGGFLIVSTFSLSGPEKCSGLNVSQYSPETLNSVFNGHFKLIRTLSEVHTSPYNTSQDFVCCVFARF
jgi:ubiquinone/menaquinone biosynthesis C-methylase UbiE